MSNEISIPIPARIRNVATGGHVCGAEDIDFGQKVVHLVPSKTFAEQVSAQNTIYVIHDDFTLTGDVTIPANCVLEFDGGSIKNVSGNNYYIKGIFSINDVMYQIFDNIVFIKDETIIKCDGIRPEWFGAKGDYNPINRTGTDDSNAFINAISASTILGVKKVKLRSCFYLISLGIQANNGITFEGVHANMREENFEQNKECSTLITNSSNPIITFGDDVKQPVYFKDINFESTYIENQDYTQICNFIGIKFSSLFSGPTWPFVIERCHFYGFKYSILFDNNNINNYIVSFVKIRDCAFTLNDWCVYFAQTESGEDSASLSTRHCTLGFEFLNNTCHNNTNILHISCGYEYLKIKDCNLEGNRNINLDGTPASPYSLDLNLFTGCTLEFTGCHMEGNLHDMKIHSIVNYSHLDIHNNNIYGATVPPKLILNHKYSININDCDFPLYVKSNFSSKIYIDTNKILDIHLLNIDGNSCTILHNCNNVNCELEQLSEGVVIPQDGDFKYVDNELFVKNFPDRLSNYSYMVNNENGENYYAFVTTKILSKENSIPSEPYILYNSGVSLIYVDVSNARGYSNLTSLCVFNHPSIHPTLDIIPNQQIYTLGACHGVVKANENIGLYNFFSRNVSLNYLASNKLSNIINPIIGKSIFLTDSNKLATYNGTNWVDATGQTV